MKRFAALLVGALSFSLLGGCDTGVEEDPYVDEGIEEGYVAPETDVDVVPGDVDTDIDRGLNPNIGDQVELPERTPSSNVEAGDVEGVPEPEATPAVEEEPATDLPE